VEISTSWQPENMHALKRDILEYACSIRENFKKNFNTFRFTYMLV